MKKVLTLLLAAALVLPLFAQDKSSVSEEKNVLKINTLSLIVATGSLFYERELTEMISGQMGVGYLSYSIDESKFSGLILTPEARFYPKRNAIDGFYLAPYLRYQNFSIENTTSNAEATYSNIGGGVAFGRQWILNSGFTMDLFFGGHYGSGKISVDSGNPDDFATTNFEGFRMRFGFAIGFAF
jgi:hypothetical protein